MSEVSCPICERQITPRASTCNREICAFAREGDDIFGHGNPIVGGAPRNPDYKTQMRDEEGLIIFDGPCGCGCHTSEFCNGRMRLHQACCRYTYKERGEAIKLEKERVLKRINAWLDHVWYFDEQPILPAAAIRKKE